MNDLNDIIWLGNAGFYFTDKKTGNKIYYVDPFLLTQANLPKGDLVFITHAHPDHLSPVDIVKVVKNTSIIIAPQNCLDKITWDPKRQFPVEPNKEYTLQDFRFLTIPAYNIHPDRLMFHPKDSHWVGYVFYLNGKKIYHAGDTDYIPEMQTLKEKQLDVALLPIGGTYTMDVAEASAAANAIGAKITIPIHYKRQLGDKCSDAETTFKTNVVNSQVIILQQLA